MQIHIEFMIEAMKEAKHALSLGEVPVGAIIVQNNKIVARAYQRVEQSLYVGAHAEMLAIQKASQALNSWRLENCSLYTTLEPCPMCVGASVLSRVQRIYFGAFDKRLGAAGSLFNLVDLNSIPHRPEVCGGILEQECASLLTDFFKEIRKN